MATFTLTDNGTDESGNPTHTRDPIDDGAILEAEVLEVEERDSFFWIDKDDPSQGKQREISFKFRITEEGTFNGRFIWGSTPTWFNNHPNCKLRIWVQEVLQQDELSAGFEFDTDDLVGLPVKVVVSQYPKKDGTTGNKVSDLLRISGYTQFAEDLF